MLGVEVPIETSPPETTNALVPCVPIFTTSIKQELTLIIGNPDASLTEIWLRGANAWENLNNDVERYRFRNHYRQYINIILAYYETEDIEYPISLQSMHAKNMLGRPGFAHCYKHYAKRLFINKNKLMILWDKTYEEFYGEDISSFIPEQISTTLFVK